MTDLGTKEFWDRIRGNPGELAREICSIDLVNLDETLERHAGLRAWINAAFETARINEERAKWELSKVKARALLRIRGEPDPSTKKTKTVQVIDAEVELDEEVVKATERYLTAGEIKGALRGMADALGDRKDMLVQISAKQRQELKDS